MESPTVDLSLVVLASNEHPDLGLFAEMMDVYRGELDDQPRSYEVIVVDDGIGGAFFDAVMALKEGWPELRAIQFRRSFGESIALDAAVKHARGRYVITSGWYLQVDARGLKQGVELLDSGVDYVAMRREPRCDGAIARLQSWLFNTYTRWITKANLHDLNCSFRAFKREVVEELRFHGDMFRFISILAIQQGFRVREIPLQHLREEGRSTLLSPGIYLRRFLDILALLFLIKFTKKPLRFFGMVGFAFFATGFGISAYMAWIRLVGNQPLADKPMLILGIFLMVLGIIIGSIGLIGEIIIFTHGKDVRDYHIAQVIAGDGSLPASADPGSSMLTIHGLNPATRERWREFVAGHEHGTLFHELEWREMLERTFNHESLYRLAMRGGRVVGVLPLMGIRSMFLGRSVVSVPFGVYGGLLASDSEAARALCREARQLADERDAGYVELRHLHVPPGMEELPESDLYHTFLKELPGDPDDVLPSIPRKARAKVRKALGSGDVRVGIDEVDIETFHGLFVANKRKLGSPPFPKSLFYNLRDTLGDRVSLVSVHKGARVVAAVMSFRHRETLMAYYSGATGEANRIGANNLMYAALMQEAIRRGARTFDFGRSRRDTGSSSFKHNQGFVPTPLHYQYLLREGADIPSHNNSNPRYEMARRVFRLLPRAAGERVGSYVTKRLPI